MDAKSRSLALLEGIGRLGQNSPTFAGAHDLIARLPERYVTTMGRWFGGVELSTGEWQQLALSLAFLRKARLIIPDEPTSMLDA